MDTALEIIRDQDPDARTVLVVRGEVDIHTAPSLRSALNEEAGRATALVLDVSGAVLIDAASLRVLTAAQRQAADLGKPPITLRGVRPLLAKTLHLAGLDHLFPRDPHPPPSWQQATGAWAHPRSPRPDPPAPANPGPRSRSGR